MVTTRRTAANAIAVIHVSTTRPEPTSSTNAKRVVYTNKITQNTAATPKSSIPIADTLSPVSISEQDVSISPNLTGQCPETMIMDLSDSRTADPNTHEQEQCFTRRVLRSRPQGVSGSVNNPISIFESPPPKSVPAPPQSLKRKSQHQPEPHTFINRGYRQLYPYRQTRPTPAPQPAGGTTFTGNKSQDVYRALNAKSAAALLNAKGMNNRANAFVPFAVQFPNSAQYLANYKKQRHSLPAKMTPSPPVPGQTEEMLRNRAVQYVREYSRRTPRKSALSNTDMEETSTSESEEPAVEVDVSNTSSTDHDNATKSKFKIFSDTAKNPSTTETSNENFDLIHFTEHTTLITSLLKLYPNSKDQQGLREDIAMLVSAQNQRFSAWNKNEAEAMRQKKRAKARDDKMRAFLSSESALWQNAGGLTLPEVYDTREEGGEPSEAMEEEEPSEAMEDAEPTAVLDE